MGGQMHSLETLRPPAPLRALKQWLVWKFVTNPQEGKKDLKVPFYATNGSRRGRLPGSDKKIGQSSPEDIANLVTFEEAVAFAVKGGFKGVGIAMVHGCQYTALDFDNCVADGVIDPQVENAVMGTYSELSPSGNGVRAFVQGELGNRKDCAKPGSADIGLEVFNTSGFVTFTGNATELCLMTGSDSVIAPPNEAFEAMYAGRFKRSVRPVAAYEAFGEPQVEVSHDEIVDVLSFMSCETYDEWKNVGMALHHQFNGDAEGFCIWDEWSQAGSLYPGPDAVAAKWNSFGSYNGRPLTFAGVVREAHKAGCMVNIDTAEVDDFEVLEPLPKPKGGHFGFSSLAEMRAMRGRSQWLIKGILPKADIGMLIGASASGKSFALIDMCAAVVRGIDWNGFKTKKGRVLYVVAEGRGGFPDRMEAYLIKNSLKDEALDGMRYVCRNTPNLTDDTNMAVFKAELKADVEQNGPYDLIVMDTLAQVTTGANENSGEDMGTAMANARAIGEVGGNAMILLVHHVGKDTSKGARGWSGMFGAVDVEITVSRAQGLGTRSLRITKIKDGNKEGLDIGFKLVDVPLYRDEDDEEVGSCTVEYTTAPKVVEEVSRPKVENHRIVLGKAHEMIGLASDGRVLYDELKEAAKDLLTVKDETKRDQRKRDSGRAIDALLAGGWLISIENGYLILPEEKAQ